MPEILGAAVMVVVVRSVAAYSSSAHFRCVPGVVVLDRTFGGTTGSQLIAVQIYWR